MKPGLLKHACLDPSQQASCMCHCGHFLNLNVFLLLYKFIHLTLYNTPEM